MNIKEMPENERPQEKLFYSGVQSLTTAELLALVIRTGSREMSAVQLAEEVIAYARRETGSLKSLEAAELRSITGIGDSKACSIAACIELARRLSSGENQYRKRIRGAQDIADMLMEQMSGRKKEHLIMFILNAKCEVESQVTVSIGELTQASMHPREVFNPAIKWGAAAIIIAHNHPSGDPSPSEDDILSTMRLVEASKFIGIKVLDHIVIGEGSYISMHREGLVKF